MIARPKVGAGGTAVAVAGLTTALASSKKILADGRTEDLVTKHHSRMNVVEVDSIFLANSIQMNDDSATGVQINGLRAFCNWHRCHG